MEVSKCEHFDYKIDYAATVSRRRWAHKIAADQEINDPLKFGAVDEDTPLLDVEMANDELWRKGTYGKRWLAGDYSNPGVFYSLDSLNNMEGEGKENGSTSRYDILVHLVLDNGVVF